MPGAAPAAFLRKQPGKTFATASRTVFGAAPDCPRAARDRARSARGQRIGATRASSLRSRRWHGGCLLWTTACDGDQIARTPPEPRSHPSCRQTGAAEETSRPARVGPARRASPLPSAPPSIPCPWRRRVRLGQTPPHATPPDTRRKRARRRSRVSVPCGSSAFAPVRLRCERHCRSVRPLRVRLWHLSPGCRCRQSSSRPRRSPRLDG